MQNINHYMLLLNRNIHILYTSHREMAGKYQIYDNFISG